MRIAIWDHPVADLMAAAFSRLRGYDVQVVRADEDTCAMLIRTGQADVALLSPLRVLLDVQAYDVLPAAALSTWSYPFAKLVLPGELGESFPTIHVEPRNALENLAALIVLGELYDVEPSVVPCESCDAGDLVAAGEAVVICGRDAVKAMGPTVLDVGQEWYEFSNYPLVLGLLTTGKGGGDAEAINMATALAEEMDEAREEVKSAAGSDLEAFYREDLRTRFDDLATASLTEFSEYLLYYGVVEEVPELPVVYIEDEEEGEDEGSVPLL